MNYLFKTLVLNVFIFSTFSVIENKKLKLVFVVFRHGDRTPIFTYPTDPYSDFDRYWPDGFGQLTAKGKQRMYSIGKYIRKRYKDFLTDNPREVFVRSSEKERCLESASLLLSGLYPPVGRWVWDDNIGKVWQPFPIHTQNLLHDGYLNPDAICPMATKESQRILESEVYMKFLQNNKDIIKLLEKETGLPFNNHTLGRDLFSTIFIQKQNGLKLPDWITESVFKDIGNLADMSFTFDASTQLIRRFRTGLVLKEIIQNIKRSIFVEKFTQKIFLYSTHDTFVSVFLRALNSYDYKQPPFGATVFLELYETSKDQFSLELSYLSETEKKRPHSLSMNCNNDIEINQKCNQCIAGCSLENFLDLTKNLIPEDWDKECQLKESHSNYSLNIDLEL